MKKSRERNRKTGFLLYAVLGLFCWTALPAFSGISDAREGSDAAKKSAILSLVDPFIPKIKAPVEPEPVKPVPAVDIVDDAGKQPPSSVQQDKPLPPPPREAPKIVVTGIIYSPSHPMAIIDGKIVEQGQTVSLAEGDGKFIVRSIGKHRVEILYMGLPFTILTDQGE